MPRTTTKQYIYRYVVVRVVWTRYNSYYSFLSPGAQAHLHDFFQPSLELTDAELLAHRRKISMERPALPQQAGRAYAQLMRIVEQAERQPSVRSRGAGSTPRSVTVRAVRRPEPDMKRLASIFMDLAFKQQRDHK